jgi:hypothetical protein
MGFAAGFGIRDLRITRSMLYQLSYRDIHDSQYHNFQSMIRADHVHMQGRRKHLKMGGGGKASRGTFGLKTGAPKKFSRKCWRRGGRGVISKNFPDIAKMFPDITYHIFSRKWQQFSGRTKNFSGDIIFFQTEITKFFRTNQNFTRK